MTQKLLRCCAQEVMPTDFQTLSQTQVDLLKASWCDAETKDRVPITKTEKHAQFEDKNASQAYRLYHVVWQVIKPAAARSTEGFLYLTI